MSQYEKMKKYDALLQRYLALIKQGQKDERRVTLMLHRDPSSPEAEPQPKWEIRTTNEAVDEILTNLPLRNCKNAEYIMKKLSRSDGGWNLKGDFVYKGTAVKGSYMIDLLKYLSLAYKKKSRTAPRDWTNFLNALAELNIPLSSVSNPQACEQYERLKMEGAEGVSKEK